jgi:hypothetical protein
MSLLHGRFAHRKYWDQWPKIGPFFRPDALAGYYFDVRGKYPYIGETDNGIPVVCYGDGPCYPNPVIVAQCGLGALDTWRTSGDETALASARSYAAWFMDSQTADGAWLLHHDVRCYRITGTWSSCLGQGQGISFLVRMFALSENDRYLNSARKAASSLLRPVDAGGASLVLEDGRQWLEEYPSSKPSLVLNGHIYASLGLRDLWLATGDASYRDDADLFIASTADRLKKYDDAGWSLYDLADRGMANVASRVYHARHIVQLEVLSRISSRVEFSDYARRWRTAPNARVGRAVAQKVLYRMIYGW